MKKRLLFKKNKTVLKSIEGARCMNARRKDTPAHTVEAIRSVISIGP